MITIKIIQRTGYGIMPEVMAAAAENNCALAVFSSESSKDGIDRENIIHNLLLASRYGDGRPYSIIMDDDVIIQRDAIRQGINHIESRDIVTFPVNRYSRVQHAFMVVKNEYLEKHPFEFVSANHCNQCVWLGKAKDIHRANVLTMKQPLLKTAQRIQLKRRIK